MNQIPVRDRHVGSVEVAHSNESPSNRNWRSGDRS